MSTNVAQNDRKWINQWTRKMFNAVGHTCSSETIAEGLGELWPGYDVTLTRLDSIQSLFSWTIEFRD